MNTLLFAGALMLFDLKAAVQEARLTEARESAVQKARIEAAEQRLIAALLREIVVLNDDRRWDHVKLLTKRHPEWPISRFLRLGPLNLP